MRERAKLTDPGGSAISQPRRNIELKFRLADLATARNVAKQRATQALGIEHQVDTYFHCRHGRLKLRQIDRHPAQLVWYERPDEKGARTSDYYLVPVSNPETLKIALTAAWGIRGTIEKSREIYLIENVRVHLDEVNELGTFLEFESVLSPRIGDARGREQLVGLCKLFGLDAQESIAGSYSDLAGI